MINDPLIWQSARQRMPLPFLMTNLGDGIYTKKGANCPFCDAKKGKWAVYEKESRWYFKCHSPGCVAENPDAGNSEIGYIALRKGLDSKEASKEYLRIAVPELVPHLFDDNGDARREETPEPREPEPRDGEPTNVWWAFWKKLALNSEDRMKLKTQRGFSDYTIDRLGFRSNHTGNMPLLEALAGEIPMDELLAEGLFKEDARGIKPVGQFFGYGITSKKDKRGKNIFELNNPIIIPYLDELARPTYLRPHKGGVRKPTDELMEEVELFEDEEPSTCAAHVYCPFLLSDLIAMNDGVCVLTEGEFKAAALWQCGIAAIACPGITFVRNQAFKKELIEILTRFGITDLVIIFDNEVKDDPAFPDKYKADPWKRYDTPMWAEYAAIDLRDYFASVRGTCRIGWLPDEWRVNGKADFDGILAKCVGASGLDEGTKQARRVFRTAIETSSEKPGAELFPSEGRRIVECRLQRLFYKPLIMQAGLREITLARRFSEFDPKTKEPVDEDLAKLFRSLIGCYYKRAKVRPADYEALVKGCARMEESIAEVKADPNKDDRQRKKELSVLYGYLASMWEKRKGLPEAISNFTLSCEYKLHVTTGDVHRLVSVRDSKDRVRDKNGALRRLSPQNLARLSDFRQWCYATGEAVWAGGDKELQHLVQDMDHFSYLRDIHEVPAVGFHEASKCWFFGDCAFSPQGKLIMPDAANIFWYEGIGYQLDNNADDRSFVQGMPLLLSPQGALPPLEKPDVASIFRQMCEDLFCTIGGYDAWLIIGLTLAYGFAPELLKAGGHPGPWLSGKMSGGKTSIARWLMRIWGFKDLGGVRIGESTSHTALNRILAQYSCLPVWLDEFRAATIDAFKEDVLRGAFDRSAGAKGRADHSNKTNNATTLTTPIISGESSTRDAATRSRYGHISVSANRRIGDGTARYARVQNECKHYYHVGRWIMENRAAFSKLALEKLDKWMTDPDVKKRIVNERVRHVHGTAIAAFTAFTTLLGERQTIMVEQFSDDSGTDEEYQALALARLADYEEFLKKHGEQALQDVIDDTFLNQYWRDLISGIQLNKIPSKFFATKYVKVEPTGKLTETPASSKDAVFVCYVAPEAVFAAYQAFKAGQREDAQLKLPDIRREMEKEPYWMAYPTDKALRVHRITLDKHKVSCWVINLERHPPKNNTPGAFIFPFAEDLINALEDESTAENATSPD